MALADRHILHLCLCPAALYHCQLVHTLPTLATQEDTTGVVAINPPVDAAGAAVAAPLLSGGPTDSMPREHPVACSTAEHSINKRPRRAAADGVRKLLDEVRKTSEDSE